MILSSQETARLRRLLNEEPPQDRREAGPGRAPLRDA
jgi:hypothetical protein